MPPRANIKAGNAASAKIEEAMREAGLSESDLTHYMDVLGEPYVLRGTTQGYSGNHPDIGACPATIDPAVALAYAIESQTNNGGTGVVYFGKAKVFSDTIEVGNYLRVQDAEVTLPISTATAPSVAPSEISIPQARAILRTMGYDLPMTIPGKNNLRPVLQDLEGHRMTPEQIKAFMQQAQQQQGGP